MSYFFKDMYPLNSVLINFRLNDQTNLNIFNFLKYIIKVSTDDIEKKNYEPF